MIITKKSKIEIIIPESPTDRENFAAGELCCHIEKIFGNPPEIRKAVSENADAVFVIGSPLHNKKSAELISIEDFDAKAPGPEGIMIKSFGEKTILLAGSSGLDYECEVGTIYAVYEFLERFLGVSFAAYVNSEIKGGDEIPSLDEISLDNIEYIKEKADREYRTAIVQYNDEQGNPDHQLNVQFFNWLVRNRYNRILTWNGIYEGFKANGMIKEAEKRGIRFTTGHHASSKTFLPPYGNEYFKEHYFETHPEYYKMLSNGERFVPEGWYGQWIFCSQNEELIEVISQNIIEWIGKNPSVDIIAFWPQDGTDEQCSCEKCSKYSKIHNYTYFLNSVAKRVSKVYPNVKIDMLVYTDLWDPPTGLELDPHLIVDEATWHESGLRCAGKPDGTALIGTFYEDNLLNWKKLGAKVVYYDYYMGVYSARQKCVPMADEIQALAKRCVEKDIMGAGTQIECFNMWNHIFNFYCYSRCLYDTELSMEKNLEKFSAIFGRGKEYISEIIRKYEECYDGQTNLGQGGLYLMQNINKEEIYALYEKALAEAETSEHRNNIRMMRMAFRYSDLEAREYVQGRKYTPIWDYEDETGELLYMQQFDSFKHNDPGYGIMIPVESKTKEKFVPDRWYEFEK